MNFGLSAQALSLIQAVFHRYPEIRQAKVFGSRAMGNYRENSDIDIALFGDVDQKTLSKISFQLEELPLPYQFDLLCFNQITHEGLKEHILKYGKEL